MPTISDYYPYEEDDNPDERFATAVRNNQPNAALHFLVQVINKLQEELKDVRAELDKSKTAKKPAAKKATAASKAKDDE